MRGRVLTCALTYARRQQRARHVSPVPIALLYSALLPLLLLFFLFARLLNSSGVFDACGAAQQKIHLAQGSRLVIERRSIG